ncbi:MAG TPA: YraN family protein, partial [Terriglobales bacterium]|nr:YraN family protein [Terriglobales bacterium]
TRALNRTAVALGRDDERAAHLKTGERGEEEAYFYLRKVGYTMVARNFRSPRRRGEIDLIGYEKDVLCFIEVKTRTTRAVAPAEAAVDKEKQRDLTMVAEEYLRRLKCAPKSRFDVVSVYYEGGETEVTLFRGAF